MNRRFSLCFWAGGLSFALVAGSVLVMAGTPPNFAAGAPAGPTQALPAALRPVLYRALAKDAANDAHARYSLTVDPLVWTGWVGHQFAPAAQPIGGAQFGFAVAASGDTILVGANDAYINGVAWVGAAYVFTRSNGVWTEAAKLTASDGAENDHFGDTVALDGTTAVVGVPDHATNGNFWQGAAYVFTESNGNWTLAAELSASDGAAYDNFGNAVAVSGNTILVGAPQAKIGSNGNQGAAYVFTRSGATWSQAAKLTASDGTLANYFGSSVALAGDTALVGSIGTDGGGAAYVFTGSGGNWTQAAKLVGNDTPNSDERLGLSVALAPSGTTALVGAPYLSTHGNANQGAAYVFVRSGETWSQAAELTASDTPLGYFNFGWSVAISGDTAFIGAPFYGYQAGGAAFVFVGSGSNWTQTQELTESWGATQPCGGGGTLYGWSVALLGNDPVAGHPGAFEDCHSDIGLAYVYGQGALGFAVSAPATVAQGQTYVSQAIATNNAGVASPAVTATVLIPAAASFISATPSQGSCSEPDINPPDRTTVVCNFGPIAGNAGTATANIMLKATAPPGSTIVNSATVAFAHPPLAAAAPTLVTEAVTCPGSYTQYDGTLSPGQSATTPSYQAPAGRENAILTAPARFQLSVQIKLSASKPWKTYSIPGYAVHKRGPAGKYRWVVKAKPTSDGGDYTLCIQHP